MCSLCSRLRRGVLYRVASEIGATRSRWAITATTSWRRSSSTCSSRQDEGMSPKLQSDDGKHVIIRPLAYVRKRTRRIRHRQQFPIIPCDLCGSQETLQRKQ